MTEEEFHSLVIGDEVYDHVHELYGRYGGINHWDKSVRVKYKEGVYGSYRKQGFIETFVLAAEAKAIAQFRKELRELLENE
jgi:hypothetical protein